MAKICIKCQQSLPADAKFCMHCGTPVASQGTTCPKCHQHNPAGTKCCYHCGVLMTLPDTLRLDYIRQYELSGDTEHITSLLEGLFFKNLKSFVVRIFNDDRYSDYVELYYTTDMHKKFATKAVTVAKAIERANLTLSRDTARKADHLVSQLIRSMTYHHIIYYGRTLHPCPIPESILWYQDNSKKNLILKDMIFDFLAPETEKIKIYTDFLQMPPEKLKNAAQSFLNADNNEIVYFIGDQSLFGSVKEGFAMTNFGLYWKAELQKPCRILYHELSEITRKDQHLLINGHFFNVNPCFNIRMHLLLIQLQEIFVSNDVI